MEKHATIVWWLLETNHYANLDHSYIADIFYAQYSDSLQAVLQKNVRVLCSMIGKFVKILVVVISILLQRK